MNLREAAKQALEALLIWQDSLTNPDAQPGWRFFVVGEKAIANLCDALYEDAMQRFTDVQQQIERHADTSKTSDHFPDATKMMATIRPEVTVEPVATINEMETVERLAREAGDDWDSTLPSDKEFLARFAAIAIAANREACAKVCEEHWRHSGNAMNCADAIRARGNQE